ncbi:hypothetical protein ACJX0J_022056, partial [Zea mays]
MLTEKKRKVKLAGITSSQYRYWTFEEIRIFIWYKNVGGSRNDVIFNNAIVISLMQRTAEEGAIAAKGCFNAARDNYDGHLRLGWME